MKVTRDFSPADMRSKLTRFFEVSGKKIMALERSWVGQSEAPVLTVGGQYVSRHWTEWTQGFRYGSMLLQYDATGEREFLDGALNSILHAMAPHLTDMGVHDHGFTTVSTFGNLLRIVRREDGTLVDRDRDICELALKVSGAVQAARWTQCAEEGSGYIYSFNGQHSLFIDTVRTLRSLALSHALGHELHSDHGERINIFERLLAHLRTTIRYSVYFGDGRDAFDVLGRVAHESIFNTATGSYRCPSTQQGYSPFSTWMRGLAWAILGFAEQLEFLSSHAESEPEIEELRQKTIEDLERALQAVTQFYLHNTPLDGIPFWDSGAPNLWKLGEYQSRVADPFNGEEPVDSSAAAIAAQGFIRYGRYLNGKGCDEGVSMMTVGLDIASTLFEPPYLSLDDAHEGLLLHTVYHRPRGWDSIPAGGLIPCGESGMWGDYHARELALLILRLSGGAYYRFDDCLGNAHES